MKIERYLKYRGDFIDQYKTIRKNDFGFASLDEFKIRNFEEFIFYLSLDFIDVKFSITNMKKKYNIKQGKIASGIKIISIKSMFDKYPKQFNQAIKYYISLSPGV